MDFFVHESSYVDEGAQIGADTKIWHFCHVMGSAKIGECCNIGQNVFVAADVTIGKNVKIQNNVSLYTGVVVEDDVFLGPSMVLTNVINPRSHVSRKGEYKTTLIKKGTTVGANATIVCGITLGQYCFIGAGAVVTHSVPNFGLVYGNPGRVQGWMCQCGVRLEFETVDGQEQALCPECGERYTKNGEVVTPLHTNNGNGVTSIGNEE